MIRPFCGYQTFWPSDLDLWLTFKNFNLGHGFLTRRERVFYISYVHSLWQDLPTGTNIFYLVTLTLKFDLLLKNFNQGHSFPTRRDRAFIFHMYIPCDKTFPQVLTFLDSDLNREVWPTFKTVNLGHSFPTPEEIGLSFFICTFLVTRPFHRYQSFDLVTLTLRFDLL